MEPGPLVARLMLLREKAVAMFDWHLVSEIDHQLHRHGFVAAPGKTDEGPAVYERAVKPTVKRGPGRPRKDEQ